MMTEQMKEEIRMQYTMAKEAACIASSATVVALAILDKAIQQGEDGTTIAKLVEAYANAKTTEDLAHRVAESLEPQGEAAFEGAQPEAKEHVSFWKWLLRIPQKPGVQMPQPEPTAWPSAADKPQGDRQADPLKARRIRNACIAALVILVASLATGGVFLLCYAGYRTLKYLLIGSAVTAAASVSAGAGAYAYTGHRQKKAQNASMAF